MRGFCYVLGVNTGVGKTLASAGLARALAQSGARVDYVKPLQTGYPRDCDGELVARLAGVRSRTFFAWEAALSPHRASASPSPYMATAELAAGSGSVSASWRASSAGIASDAEIDFRLASLQAEHRCAGPGSWTFVEGAGGVLSPSASGTLQADLFRRRIAPVLLVGDARLGGISCTLSAVESLRLRGFDLDGIVLLGDALANAEAISRALHFPVEIWHASAPVEGESLELWCERSAADFARMAARLEAVHAFRASGNRTLAERAQRVLWWPFTQHEGLRAEDIKVIDSGIGDAHLLLDAEGNGTETSENGSGSWWTQGLPYGDAAHAAAAAWASARYGHTLFAARAHAPAVKLAEAILASLAPGWGERVFYSDNGSTAVEVALKIAFRWAEARGAPQGAERIVVGLEGSYHGDTLGTLDCTAPDVFKDGVDWYRPRGVWLAPPCYSMVDGAWELRWEGGGTGERFTSRECLFSACRASSPLASRYEDAVRACFERIGEGTAWPMALVVEPLVLGTGGMRFVDPLYLRLLVRIAREKGLLIVFDEIFTGCHRLGAPTAAALLGEDPDVACYGKLLTGGSHPLGVTVARKVAFETFLSPLRTRALLHGHSYTAAPAACGASLHALESYEAAARGGRAGNSWDDAEVKALARHPLVESARHMGGILAWDLPGGGGYASDASQGLVRALARQGVQSRALGATGYLLARPFGSKAHASLMLQALRRALDSI